MEQLCVNCRGDTKPGDTQQIELSDTLSQRQQQAKRALRPEKNVCSSPRPHPFLPPLSVHHTITPPSAYLLTHTSHSSYFLAGLLPDTLPCISCSSSLFPAFSAHCPTLISSSSSSSFFKVQSSFPSSFSLPLHLAFFPYLHLYSLFLPLTPFLLLLLLLSVQLVGPFH